MRWTVSAVMLFALAMPVRGGEKQTSLPAGEKARDVTAPPGPPLKMQTPAQDCAKL